MSAANRSYYDVLGVPRDADAETIKRAFRARARELHPDLSEAGDADERFAELSRAYNVLSKPTARILYDRVGYLGRGNGGFEPGHGGVSETEGPSSLFDLAEVEVEFLEAVRGTTRRIRVESVGTCTSCHGSGAAPGSTVENCRVCEGHGRVRRTSEVGTARVLQVETCPACSGAGLVVREPCADCGGSGKASEVRKVKVRIPPGTEDGARIRVESEARAGSRGRRRDVYLVLRVLPEHDSRAIRYSAALALGAALALLLLVLARPEAFGL